MHEPLGQVHFVVFEKFTRAYLFQIARENHVITYTNNIHKKHNFNSKFWQRARF